MTTMKHFSMRKSHRDRYFFDKYIRHKRGLIYLLRDANIFRRVKHFLNSTLDGCRLRLTWNVYVCTNTVTACDVHHNAAVLFETLQLIVADTYQISQFSRPFSENVTRLVASRCQICYIRARSLLRVRTTYAVNARRKVSDHFRTNCDADTSLVFFCSGRQRTGSAQRRLWSCLVVERTTPCRLQAQWTYGCYCHSVSLWQLEYKSEK